MIPLAVLIVSLTPSALTEAQWVWPAPPPVYQTPPGQAEVHHHHHHHQSAAEWKRSIGQEVRRYCEAHPKDESCPHGQRH